MTSLRKRMDELQLRLSSIVVRSALDDSSGGVAQFPDAIDVSAFFCAGHWSISYR